MRAIRIIFRRELGAYVRQPFIWALVSLVLIVNGILFRAFVLTGGEQLSAYVLDRYFYYSSGVTFGAGILLSFRLISEERQTQSLVLLNTSPIRDSEIVIGKYLAALVFLALTLAMTIYLPLLIKVEGKITLAQVLVGYLGLLMLGSAVLSIGLFVSALTKNQLIAGFGTLVIVALMFLLFPLAKSLDQPVRGSLGDLDIWWIHFQNGFERGILNLKDIVYYIAVTYFFLLLAVKSLEAKRWQ